MKLTVLKQFAKGLIRSSPDEGDKVDQALESTKWYLWHGNVSEALDHLEGGIQTGFFETILNKK